MCKDFLVNTMDVKLKIKEWLSKSGYPLELYTQKVFSSKKYFCEKSALYLDNDLSASREIDLIAVRRYNPHESDRYSYGLKFIIECKKSEKPLLVLCEAEKYENRFNYFFGNEVHFGLNRFVNFSGCYDLFMSDKHEQKNDLGMFFDKQHLGYSVVQAFSKTDENIYKGIMGLAKANQFYRREHIELLRHERVKPHFDQDINFFMLFVPVLVVDAPIYNVYLDESGQEQIVETNWSSLDVKMQYGCNQELEQPMTYNIQIVNKNYLDVFVEEVEKIHKLVSDPKNENLYKILDVVTN